MKINTVSLNDGTVVLAKPYKGRLHAITYANRTQALAAAAKYSGEVIQRQGRPFYVKATPQPDTERKMTNTEVCNLMQSMCNPKAAL